MRGQVPGQPENTDTDAQLERFLCTTSISNLFLLLWSSHLTQIIVEVPEGKRRSKRETERVR